MQCLNTAWGIWLLHSCQVWLQGSYLSAGRCLLFHWVAGQPQAIPWDPPGTEKEKAVWKWLLLFIPLDICDMFLSSPLPVVIAGSQERLYPRHQTCSGKKPLSVFCLSVCSEDSCERGDTNGNISCIVQQMFSITLKYFPKNSGTWDQEQY